LTERQIERTDRQKNARRAVAILNMDFMDVKIDLASLCGGDDRTLLALDLLAGVKAARPAASEVFTDLLSKALTVGLASRLVFSRAAMTRM